MNEHHQVNVIRISEVRPHPNADRLEVIPIDGYQAVVAKGQFKLGDLAYYIPPDSVVPEREEFAFLWASKGEMFPSGVPASKRRITARRLRGEWSEGLLMSCKNTWNVGQDVSVILGIEHYNPPEPGPDGEPKRRRVFPRSFRGAVYMLKEEWSELTRMIKSAIYTEKADGNPGVPDYSIQAFKKFPNKFEAGQRVRVTEKIHGSNARYSFRKNIFGFGGKMYVGSHYTWRNPNSGGEYTKALRDNPYIERWCRANPGWTLYGEIAPTQKRYSYGAKGNEVLFFVFDVLSPIGRWQNLDDVFLPGIRRVPTLYYGPFDEDAVKALVDGPSEVDGADHIREGVVVEEVTVLKHIRIKLKIVSNAFLEREK